MKTYNKIYTVHAWKDNNKFFTVVQGEGGVKYPRLKIIDDNGSIDLTDASITYTVTLPRGSEEIVDATIVNATQGIVEFEIKSSMTAQAGLGLGELNISVNNKVLKIGGINLNIAKATAGSVIEASEQFSALIEALAKVANLKPDGTIELDDTLNVESTKPIQNQAVSKPIKAITATQTGKNLYNCATEPLNATIDQGEIKSSVNGRVLLVKVKPNTTYTISRQIASARFSVGQASVTPIIGTSVTNVKYANSALSKTITTANNTTYLCVYYYLSTVDTEYTELQLRKGYMVELGDTATDFEVYTETIYVPDNALSAKAQKVIDEQSYHITDRYNSRAKIYGVEFDLTNSSPQGTRIADSKDLSNDYVVGDNFANGGHNDFDTIFPYCDMRRCNVIVTDGIKNIIYEGEDGFALDGSQGNVMVEIPKFYFSRENNNNKERWLISGYKQSGFEVAPLFIDANNTELDYAYIGAYDMAAYDGNKSVDINNSLSRSGAVVKTSTKLDTVSSNPTYDGYRSAAGKIGMGIFDLAALLTIQMLWVVEFADRDVKKYMQGIGYLPWFSSSNNPIDSYNSTMKTVTVSTTGRSRVTSFKKGQRIMFVNNTTVISTGHYITSISFNNNVAVIGFNGDLQKDITIGTTCVSRAVQDTGLTDALNYHTGRVSGDNNLSAFRYRYIENLWGNSWNIVEGLRVKALRYYYTFDTSKYADTDITQWHKYVVPAPEQPYLGDDGKNRAWIVSAGYNIDDRNVILPSVCGTTGNNGKYFSAALYTQYKTDRYGKELDENTIYVCTNGGGFDHNTLCSPFTLRFWFGIGGEASSLHTTRLVLR